LKGIRHSEDEVLWFQHEFGIWPDDVRFINMLRDLGQTKVISPHSLHFQSSETIYGLRRREHSFLQILLPHIDTITVFSEGVYQAVTRAFPEYCEKVHILRHGTHLYPEIARMSRFEAKKRIHEFLIGESGLDQASKDKLRQEGVFPPCLMPVICCTKCCLEEGFWRSMLASCGKPTTKPIVGGL
jgi:hypothetical protein